MWGAISDASSDLVQLHLSVSDHLSRLSWNRVQIWNHRASVHSWNFGSGLTLAFDVTIEKSQAVVTLVIRQEAWIKAVRESLRREGVPFAGVESRPERLRLGSILLGRKDSPAEVADLIGKARSSIENSVRSQEEWIDAGTGMPVHYSVKPERKGCRQLVFLFTSIRTKQHWLDFGGPYGQTLSSNRARIVFVEDDFRSGYTYHLAVRGDTRLRAVTVSFVREYVEKNGYSWEEVVLAGMSKGGTAAIAIGAELPSCTVVALAPQLEPGQYLAEKHPEVLRAVGGRGGREGAELVDRIFWDGLEAQRSAGRWGIERCYVLTSPADGYCVGSLERFVEMFAEPSSVAVQMTGGVETDTHLKTVRYLSPFFVSLLGLLASGARPPQLVQGRSKPE